MSRARATHFNVLLVEDDPGDANLTKAAFAAGTFSCRLDHVLDGAEAMARLLAIADGSLDVRLPDLVLLDLNMPRKNGHQVLAEIRADDRLKDIPVLVFSTSSAKRDIALAYGGGASSFVIKPVDLDGLFAAVQSIEDYWFGLAQLPR